MEPPGIEQHGPRAGPTGVLRGAKALGRHGEDLVALWYQEQGYDLLSRNWRCREGELDIVARLGLVHVFCEVKTRSSAAFGLPAEAVGRLKQTRLRRLAAMWFAAEGGAATSCNGRDGAGRRPGGPVRFDVACVLAGVVDVIEGAF